MTVIISVRKKRVNLWTILVETWYVYFCFNWITCNRVSDITSNSVLTLLNIIKKWMPIVSPIVWQCALYRSLVSTHFACKLTTVMIIIHVILSATSYRIPCCPISNAIIKTFHIGSIIQMNSINPLTTNILPPWIIRS